MSELLPLPDSGALAREGWQIGLNLCGCPGSYHPMWAILRHAGVINGIRLDREALTAILARLGRPGGNVLIAGAADAALLQLAVSAIEARPIGITAVDLCPAPLRLIERIALPPGILLETREGNLAELDDRHRYDVALCHGVLSFMDAETRATVLRRIHAALKPDGRLVLTWRIAAISPDELTDELNRAWRAKAAAMIARRPDLVTLCGDELGPALDAWASTRALRAVPFTDVTHIVEMLGTGGFAIERHLVRGSNARSSIEGGTIPKQSHIFVARPA